MNQSTSSIQPIISEEDNVELIISKEEMDRRIAAFIASRRRERDDENVVEFCHRQSPGQANEEEQGSIRSVSSCARVDAVFTYRRSCSKSHLRRSSVVNETGPNEQTPTPFAVSERLTSIEKKAFGSPHNLRPVKKSVYERLKALEDRMAFLEGLCPEFNGHQVKPECLRCHSKRPRLPPLPPYSSLSVQSLDAKIDELRSALKQQRSKVEPKN